MDCWHHLYEYWQEVSFKTVIAIGIYFQPPFRTLAFLSGTEYSTSIFLLLGEIADDELALKKRWYNFFKYTFTLDIGLRQLKLKLPLNSSD